METNWAAEQLQTIRTLMERSALYRRALAPIMTLCGGLGIAGGIIGKIAGVRSTQMFVFFWASVAALALTGSFLLVRRQALQDKEPFWSPPTRRITQAMLPQLFIGMVLGGFWALGLKDDEALTQGILVMAWLWLYGCALHSAGFSMQRGVKVLGWVFIFAGLAFLAYLYLALRNPGLNPNLLLEPHFLMAATFGGLHLAYGLYLYFTEKGKNAA